MAWSRAVSTASIFLAIIAILPYFRNINRIDYLKIPFISPELIQLRKGFWVGLYPAGGGSGGGGGESHGSVDRNTFLS